MLTWSRRYKAKFRSQACEVISQYTSIALSFGFQVDLHVFENEITVEMHEKDFKYKRCYIVVCGPIARISNKIYIQYNNSNGPLYVINTDNLKLINRKLVTIYLVCTNGIICCNRIFFKFSDKSFIDFFYSSGTSSQHSFSESVHNGIHLQLFRCFLR